MPELPEVETIVCSLQAVVSGKKIDSVIVHDPLICKPDAVADVEERLNGAIIMDVTRRGKYVVLGLDGSGEGACFHLRMTGQLIYVPPGKDVPDRVRLEILLADGGKLVFRDVRRLGKLHLDLKRLMGLGPDPFSKEFCSWFVTAVARRSRAIKAVLLDQKVSAGVGNIYADEALFRAQIDPRRPANSLSAGEATVLAQHIREVLRDAIGMKGTSFSSYVDGRGVPGEFAQALSVYGRRGQPCLRCGAEIKRVVIGGRGSCYCPGCQR